MRTHFKPSALVPIVLLGMMFSLLMASSWNDSAIFDETAHIPAGYSYLTQRDYRLNPEHPPLAKDLAAAGLLLSGGANFPTHTASWQDQINGQWDQGRIFLYEAGNDPERILHAMRIPLILLTIVLGWLLWRFAARHFGERVAGLVIFFYALSPTFLAHGRFVTTDVAATFGFFLALAAFLQFLRSPSKKNILLTGLFFGLAQGLKFSLILLIPTYGIIIAAWAISRIEEPPRLRIKIFLNLVGKTILIGLVGLVAIWAIYAFHVWHYPADRNLADAQSIIGGYKVHSLAAIDFWLIRHPLLQPLGQYLFGVLMVAQRTAGGNTQYFLGEITSQGSHLYFPLLYLLKEPLAFHILTLIALIAAIWRVRRAPRKSRDAVIAWIRDHFVESSALIFIAVYWTSSIASPLNIGVRHVLPTFPFIYLLVARQTISWLRSWSRDSVESMWQWLVELYKIYIASIPRYLVVTLLIIWQAASVITTYPSFLSYFNVIGGGSANGYLIATDSNYDWGQDLKRLADYVHANNIQKISVDYFGGGSPNYYLGKAFEPWWPSKGYPKGGGWFAISANALMGAYGKIGPGFSRQPEDSYTWLKPFQPVARAGTSIFIYDLPPQNPKNL